MTDTTGRRALVLWDIDHTLIGTRGLGRRLYRQAFEAVTDRPVTEEVEVTGRTEQAIFTETARRHRVELTPDLAAAYRQELGRRYEEHRAELRQQGQALPGARDALAALSARPKLVQSVLTGNFRAVAKVKLEAFELDRFLDLDVGAYGEDAVDRAELGPIAQERAAERYGVMFDRGNTIIIGDSPSDVEAGRDAASVIAVATGKTSHQELEAAKPYVVLHDLGGVAEAVARILAL